MLLSNGATASRVGHVPALRDADDDFFSGPFWVHGSTDSGCRADTTEQTESWGRLPTQYEAAMRTLECAASVGQASMRRTLLEVYLWVGNVAHLPPQSRKREALQRGLFDSFADLRCSFVCGCQIFALEYSCGCRSESCSSPSVSWV